jgi:hypothetical protein
MPRSDYSPLSDRTPDEIKEIERARAEIEWAADDRARHAQTFEIIWGVWVFVFQAGVLVLLSLIAWKLWH